MKYIVVVGAGKLGTWHIEAYNRIEEARIIGIVEPIDERMAAALALEDDEARAYRSLDDALLASDVDVIDVYTPTAHHFDDVTKALDLGKSVFCEKPLVPTMAEAEAVARHMTAGPGSLRVGYVYRFHPRMQKLKMRLEAGTLGDPYLAMLRIGGRGSHRIWKHRAGMAGGALLDMATHMLDLAFWLFGSFTEAEVLHRAVLLDKREIEGTLVEVDADDLVVLRLRTVGDVSVLVHADYVTPGFAHQVEVAGTNGSASTSIVTAVPDRYALVHQTEELPSGETIEAGHATNMLQLQLESFVDDLENDRVVSDIGASLEIARVLDTAASHR